MKRVVITGLGIICGNAQNRNEFADALFAGKSGIKECTIFQTVGLSTKFFGQVDGIIGNKRLTVMAEKSVVEMMSDAGIDKNYIAAHGNSCRMFLGTFLYNLNVLYKENFNAYFNDFSTPIKILTGIRGEIYVTTSACASSTAAVGMALDYIRHGLCDCAIVGGMDPLAKYSAYGFNSLKTLSNGICNPYDESRDGINIGEGSAFFFVESMEHAKNRGAKIYCELAGYALRNDAYHITSPDPSGEGAFNVMKAALEDAKIDAAEVDYINGHGTGTRLNDTMEIKAIEKLCAETDKKIYLSSTKALVGHCMGAAGAVELASVIASIKFKKYIPMPNLKNPLPTKKIVMANKTFDLEINCALSNSFGFAGNTAALVVKRYEGSDAR